MGPKIELESNLKIAYVECPPGQVPVWREGIRLLVKLARQQHEERTAGLKNAVTSLSGDIIQGTRRSHVTAVEGPQGQESQRDE